jgi:erythronate-4-phosphate dehydrogenase
MNKTKIQVVADENISGLEHFDSIAEVSKVSGRQLSAETVKHADALLVRSISKIDKDLLGNSSVKFVASATSGIDHIDLDFLKLSNIYFAHAPGSNAKSVVQYVFASLAFLSEKNDFDWRELTFGIIGAGNVGGLLAKNLHKLNINFVIYDPYLDDSHPFSNKFASFEEALKQDVITIHTPLTKQGSYPTWHLFDENVIRALGKESIIINTSRGAVIDNQAFYSEYENHYWQCVLDVWENEPDIYMPLLKKVDIGTCHIAGYSYEGKEQGSAQIYQEFVDFFCLKGTPIYPINTESKSIETPSGGSELEQINQTILMAYAISVDYKQMLQLTELTPATTFDELRKKYSLRREFQYYRLDSASLKPAAKKVLGTLGFS